MNKKLVLIEWLDSIGVSANWESEEEILNSVPVTKCVSVGYIIRDDNHVTVIAPHHHSGEDEFYCGTMSIPNTSIVSVSPLEIIEEVSNEQ